MALTKQQLLIPRVMCVGGKDGEPNDTSGNWITGDIYYLSPWDKGTYKSYETGREVSEPLMVHLAQSMTHLFKPIPWWYGRTVEEMPLYVWLKGKSVCKVDVWDFKYEEAMIFRGNIITTVSIDLLTPADESEYQEYQKQKQ